MNDPVVISRANADTYFTVHPDASVWSTLSAPARESLVAIAQLDVEAKLPPDFPHNSFSAAAIYEQAVFLSRNQSATADGRVVQSQGIGNLSQSFQYLNSGADAIIAPRAALYIARAIKSAGRSVRLARG